MNRLCVMLIMFNVSAYNASKSLGDSQRVKYDPRGPRNLDADNND